MPIANTALPIFQAGSRNATATLSGDGGLLAYTSRDATGKQNQVTIKNMLTGTEQQIAGPNGWSDGIKSLVFSADGKHLAFLTYEAANKIYQIYVKDLQTGEFQAGSADATGKLGNANVHNTYKLSNDGRYLLFAAAESNFGIGNPAYTNIFMKDLQTGELKLVSQTTTNEASNGDNFWPCMSGDGRYVAFFSYTTNLLPSSSNQYNSPAFYIKDMQTGNVRYLDEKLNGHNDLSTTDIAFSADGSKVIYCGRTFAQYGINIYAQDMASGAINAITSDADVHFQGVPTGFPSNSMASVDSHMLYSISSDASKITYIETHPNKDEYYVNYTLIQIDLHTGTSTTIGRASNPGELMAASADGRFFVNHHDFVRDMTYGYQSTLIQVSNQNNLSGNDILLPSAQNESLAGLAGNDTYYVYTEGVTVIETPNNGVDTVVSLVKNYTLPDNVENLQIGPDFYIADRPSLAENGTGNDLNNIISGNSLNNIINNSRGNDTIDGGDGYDTVVYSNNKNQYTIQQSNASIQVEKSANLGTDILKNIERIQFSDKTLAFATDTHAAQAYRIYQAAFNRKPDESGLGFWIKLIDNGTSLESIAQGFIQAPEFQNMYGQNPTNGTLVEKFYQNVLHRTPDSGGFAYWTKLLDSHTLSGAQVLASFSESPENQAALVGVLSSGISFIPFQ